MGAVLAAGGIGAKSEEPKDAAAACNRLRRSGGIAEAHYDQAYFAWQHKASLAGAEWQARTLTENAGVNFKQISERHGAVLEVGCSTGATISHKLFQNASRFCVEVNPVAVRFQREHYPSLRGTTSWSKLPQNVADFAYSFDSLEHHPSPLDSLQCLRTKIKPGGSVYIQVPFDHAGFGNSHAHEYGRKWNRNDKHFHLFTWNPQNLGNLLKAASFKVQGCIDLEAQHEHLRAEGRLEAGAGSGGPAEKSSIWCHAIK